MERLKAIILSVGGEELVMEQISQPLSDGTILLGCQRCYIERKALSRAAIKRFCSNILTKKSQG